MTLNGHALLAAGWLAGCLQSKRNDHTRTRNRYMMAGYLIIFPGRKFDYTYRLSAHMCVFTCV